MTTQKPEALRLANVCSNLTRYSMDAHLIAAELRTQNARINELESQLAQRFDAADMATAAAQGFRDGATATAQPVAERHYGPLRDADAEYGQQLSVYSTPRAQPAQQGVAYADLPDERAAFEAWYIARAIEAEVRKQDTELIRQLVEALESVDDAMPFPVARQVLKVARARLGGKP